MPSLKAGIIVREDGSDYDAEWVFGPDTTVDVMFVVNAITYEKELVLQIDPEDLLAVADAVRGMQLRQIQNNREQTTISP